MLKASLIALFVAIIATFAVTAASLPIPPANQGQAPFLVAEAG